MISVPILAVMFVPLTGCCPGGDDGIRPLTTVEIADPPARAGDVPSVEVLDRRFRNLWLMDFIIDECEHKQHIIDYKPLCVHLMYDRWRTPPLVDARDSVPYDMIDQYAAWGVQRIQLHHDTWAHMGRIEPINDAVFTRFVDYCHKKGIEVGVYLIMGLASHADPELPADIFTQPQYLIRPPDTIGADRSSYRAMWLSTDVHSPRWRHYLLDGLERLFTEYKVDGMYYDDGTVLGAFGNAESDIHNIRYWSRTGRSRLSEDMFNQLANICRRHDRWMTIYSNSARAGMNDGFHSNVIEYRLVGEAGPVKNLETFWNINRKGNRAPYHVNVWCDHNTMPPDRPFYACNLVFLQFPYLMSWRKPAPAPPGDLLFDEEQVALWAHYAGIYKEMTTDDTVAYINTKRNALLAEPITDEHVAMTVLVGENVYAIVANISDRDRTLRFTVPFHDMETGEDGITEAVLPAGGSMRMFRIDDLSVFEPEPTPAERARRRIVRDTADIDPANLALKARVVTGTDGIFHYVKATQAVDGSLETFWQPNPMKKPDYWWDTYWTTQAFDEVPPDYRDPVAKNRRWYRIELREPGQIGTVRVVTRPEDAERLRLELSNTDWDSFEAVDGPPAVEIRENLAVLTWTPGDVFARYLHLTFTGERDVNERLYEVRAYHEAGAGGTGETGTRTLRRIVCREIEGTIAPRENIMPSDPGWTTVGTHGFGAVMWQALDLGRTAIVDRIQVIPCHDEPNYCQFLLYGSADGDEWVVLVDASANTAFSTPIGMTYEIEPTPLRYVAFVDTFTSGGPLVGDYYDHEVGEDVTLDQYLKMLRDETWDIRMQSALAELRLRAPCNGGA